MNYQMVFNTVPAFFNNMVPRYESHAMRPLVATIQKLDLNLGDQIAKINPKRFNSRCHSYLIPEEIERVRKRLEVKDDCGIRFGFEKKGRGFHGDRGDFCMVGGAIHGKHLALFYRSLELIGGFSYDLALVSHLSRLVDRKITSLSIFAAKANVFALKRNSNEALYPKVRKIMGIV